MKVEEHTQQEADVCERLGRSHVLMEVSDRSQRESDCHGDDADEIAQSSHQHVGDRMGVPAPAYDEADDYENVENEDHHREERAVYEQGEKRRECDSCGI